MFSIRNNTSDQSRLINSFESIGDILVFETSREKEDDVLDVLKTLREMLKTLLDIEQKNPERFEELMVLPDYFETYRKDPEEAQMRLGFSPEKYLPLLSTILNQSKRVHDAALKVRNSEISNVAVYQTIWFLGDTLQKQKRDVIVERILVTLHSMTYAAFEAKDSSAYYAACGWYVHVLFGTFSEDRANVDYTPLLNKHLFSSLRTIIKEDQFQVFTTFVSYLVDNHSIEPNEPVILWNYTHLLMDENFEAYKKLDDEKKIRKVENSLDHLLRKINTRDQLSDWLGKFQKLTQIIDPYIKQNHSKAEDQKQKMIDSAEQHYKYQNLLRLLFGVAAYCIFLTTTKNQKRLHYIKELWEYKQPQDADASWGGTLLTPKSLQETLELYFSESLHNWAQSFWEGHHGDESYYKRYFILLLAKHINNEGGQLPDFQLPEFGIHRLSDIEYSTEELSRIAKEMGEITLYQETFQIHSEIFAEKVVELLGRIKQQAEVQIDKLHRTTLISEKKISKFKKDVNERFIQLTHIRNILAYTGNFEKKITTYQEAAQENKYEGTVDRSAFFKDWNVNHTGLEDSISSHLAHREDDILLSQCMRELQPLSFNDALKIIEEKVEDYFIITPFDVVYDFFEEMPKYEAEWRLQKDPNYKKELAVNCFSGIFKAGDKVLPIFKINNNLLGNKILILNKKHLGRLTQYSAVEGVSQDNLIHIAVRSISDDAELVSKLTHDVSPDALEKKKKELETLAWVEVTERFKYEKNPEFEAYLATWTQ